MKHIVIVMCLFMAWSGSAQSQKQKQLEEKRQSILTEIKEISSLLSKAKGEKKSLLAQVEDLNRNIDTRQKLIRVTNQQANLLSREIKENTSSIERLKLEVASLKEDYAKMISKSYKSKNDQSRMMFLFSSENFLQAYKRMKYLKQYTQHRKLQGERIIATTEELKTLNVDLEKQKKDKSKLIEENRVASAELASQKKKQEVLVADLKKEESTFIAQIRKRQREANRIDKEIDDLIRAAIAESNRKNGTKVKTATKAAKFTLTPEGKALAKNFKGNKGKLIWPVAKGRVLNHFGTRRHPQFPNITQNFNGVELITESGQKARAVFEGEVISIQQPKAGNIRVLVRHGNYITVYSNLINLKVKKGQKVTERQELGTVFTNPQTGKTTFKFVIYQNNTKLNPADWIYKM